MTTLEISQRVLARIDDTAVGSVDPGPGAIPPEILSAIVEGQELFCLLSLVLETTATFTLAGGAAFTTIRGTFPDYLAPLRLTVGGVRIRPATFAQLDASSDVWQSTPGVPTNYVTAGFNFLAVTPQPVLDTVATLTYARSPVQLVGDSFPEIPEQYHQSLVEFGIYRIKVKEGAQGLERGVKYFTEFLDAATKCAEYVRAKGRAARYDTLPTELSLVDRAHAAKG